MKNLWHKPEEKPRKRSSHWIYFIRKYGCKKYAVDSGYYVKNEYRQDEFSEYIDLEETKVFWNEIYLWCYEYEFSKMIQPTFRKRQRKYHLRNESKRIFS